MADRISQFSEPGGRLTGEAVRYWKLGKRMPKTEWVSAIQAATQGQVTANDLHAACALYRNGRRKERGSHQQLYTLSGP